MAEIEHFLDPEDKNHPKFDSVKDVEVSLYSACCQMEGKSVYKTTIGKAVGEKTIDNQTLGYFIARFVFGFELKQISATPPSTNHSRAPDSWPMRSKKTNTFQTKVDLVGHLTLELFYFSFTNM